MANAISKLIVQGFKSLSRPEPYEIEIRPLTLLAGANSSGKSSALQPLLLLKQTLESSFDPGPLLLHGPHVRFTSTSQMVPGQPGDGAGFSVGVGTDEQELIHCHFKAPNTREIHLARVRTCFSDGSELDLTESMDPDEIARLMQSTATLDRILNKSDVTMDFDHVGSKFEVSRRRCFFDLKVNRGSLSAYIGRNLTADVEFLIRGAFHIPGTRGNPERSYPVTAIGTMFPGTFENYSASVVFQWKQGMSERLKQLSEDLARLGLTSHVDADQLDATRVELKVGRLLQSKREQDLVNIADVGFGVSQTLPVVVALLAAEPGQLVYLEQPEIHLHPKAQVALAELLVNAANRGVRVVAETHSALLLLAVQTLVAEEKVSPDDVILHWFQRDDNGVTQISTAELDENGAYGDWPEDFGDVDLTAQDRYLSAAEKKLRAVGG